MRVLSGFLLAFAFVGAGCATSGPQATGTSYAMVQVSGTLVESGPDYQNVAACGAALQTFHANEGTREVWATPDYENGFQGDVSRLRLVLWETARVQRLHESGCGTGEHSEATANGTLLAQRIGWYSGGVPVRFDVEAGGVRVNGTLVAPGGQTQLPVSYHTAGPGGPDYNYTGVLTIRNLGAWPTNQIHVMEHGWLYCCPPTNSPKYDEA